MADAWLVVGLGNPGPDYQRTRHNVGVDVLDELCARAGVTRSRHRKAVASVGERRIVGGPKVVFAFPETFMNRSGGPVASLMDYYGVPIEQTIVIHDELDLPFGTVRLKRGGGAGGHNGLRDVIAARGADFIRVRVGIGRPPGRQDPADFVLKRFGGTEQQELPFMVDTAADAVEHVLRDGLVAAQQALHSP
ncbi:aminoacyl-tRNA hydrolase [Agrococcus sp. SGAir0287]|uniref:aminoacyl-tRNA hydrolase n=1 Tax=Agrococcus sp. SGAir0287 TaxID=2070347 RepID=UPI0010CCB5F5|nr:aminoacyl-tRNA hydrolase [Agrococcus sp. SGAir0287]QCR18711.1 aminoacyl-tRNA hydrolase [Agrococcus sp. SGAir0287]